MILRDSLFIASLLVAPSAMAQPTLDFDNNGPVPIGAPWAVSKYGASSMTYGVGSPGPDQLYGFWMVPTTGNQDIYYLSPTVTPTSASFPGCTVISTDGGSDTTFWKVDATGMEMLGVRSALEGVLPFSNASTELIYPITYNDSWNDSFSASYLAGGIVPVTRAGTINGVADGYGTIQLPGIELENVLRVKVRKIAIDQSSVANVRRTFDTYYYYQEGVKFPLMRASLDSTTLSAAPTITFTMDWLYGSSQVSVADIKPEDIVFTPYPNPTNGMLDLRLEDLLEVRSIEVINASGKLMQQITKPMTGTVSGVLDMSGLAAGMYQVRITRADGEQGTRRVVVQ
ncbi:MAG: T9SS type A sorting domain-containing protein [Flavobacteriales bacterium]